MNVYKNALIYRRGEIIASVLVRDGKDISGDQSALFTLNTEISRSAVDHGMPPMLADNPTTPPDVFNHAVERLVATSRERHLRAGPTHC